VLVLCAFHFINRIADLLAVPREALPRSLGEATGFHARPADPLEAFAFVGRRYANRTTEAQITALRRAGYDDLGILDLAIAVADANQWARMHRLAGVPAELLWLDVG
jgi:alkylhydroperoxidase family enzyme